MLRSLKGPERYTSAILGGALASAVLFSASLSAAERTSSSTYYEDDGWLDFSEWFDGNNYNPTDETWWRWDDEKYEAAQDLGGDIDSDVWYGYARGHQHDWFYDYYDPYWYYGHPIANVYPYGSRYYDYDKDGSYDAYASYSDWNRDGRYDSYTYYALNDSGSKQQQERAKAEAPSDSKEQSIAGTIQKVKNVQTRESPHTVISISIAKKDKAVVADLGKSESIKSLDLKVGDQITVKGPMTKVGKQSVVLAQSFAINGKNHDVNRARRQITATVLDTRKVKVRGGENLVAMVEGQGKEKSKMAVDLGPVDKLGMSLAKGKQLTFSGIPVKVKGKRLVLAQTIMKDGKSIPIERQTARNKAATN